MERQLLLSSKWNSYLYLTARLNSKISTIFLNTNNPCIVLSHEKRIPYGTTWTCPIWQFQLSFNRFKMIIIIFRAIITTKISLPIFKHYQHFNCKLFCTIYVYFRKYFELKKEDSTERSLCPVYSYISSHMTSFCNW